MANRVYGYQLYKGYQFETSPKKLQPEYEPNEIKKQNKKLKSNKIKINENSEVKKHKMTKEELQKKINFIAYIIFGFTVLFTISYRNSVINEKFTNKEALKTQLSEIQKQNEQLQVSLENELNLTNVEKNAKEKIGMNKLSNNQKVYINLPKKEYVESSKSNVKLAENRSFWQNILDDLKDYIK